jgi:hypothetical protein
LIFFLSFTPRLYLWQRWCFKFLFPLSTNLFKKLRVISLPLLFLSSRHNLYSSHGKRCRTIATNRLFKEIVHFLLQRVPFG